MRLVLLGMSHRTASLELRERFAVDDPRPFLEKLAASADVAEAVLLSTCNRVEIAVATRDPDAARLRLRSFLGRELVPAADAPPPDVLDGALYEYRDGGAVRHLFRVACSVDSLVVGEPQILGQVKDAWRAAVDCGACGPVLGRLYQRAFATAKRVRNETRISERPVSVARVAVALARQIFETLEDKAALLVGAGEMIELALETLRADGLAAVSVANRTPARAAALAARFDAGAHGLDELPQLLERADVVLTCIGGDRPLLTPEAVRAAMRQRRHRPMFVIDIGVPRNADPALQEIDGVYLYDLDDLSSLAQANAAERRREVERAEAIVVEEQQRFEGWLGALAAVPTIRALRERAEEIREAELSRSLAGIPFEATQREAVEALTRALVNKILHAPLTRLRGALEREDGLATLETVRSLFGLDGPLSAASLSGELQDGDDEASGDEGGDAPPDAEDA